MSQNDSRNKIKVQSLLYELKLQTVGHSVHFRRFISVITFLFEKNKI